MIHTVKLNDADCYAIRDALTEYYHNVSKPAIASGKLSPFAEKLHKSVRDMKTLFQDISFTH